MQYLPPKTHKLLIRSLISAGLLCISFGVSYIAFAAVPDTPANQNPQNAPRQSALSTAAQARVTNLAANISNRMEAATDRLTQIADRLESRIEKEAAAGRDTSAAEAALIDARDDLAAANATLSNIDAEVAEAVGAATPRDSIASLKETYRTVAGSIRSAHSDLRRTIAALRGTPVPAPSTATSTPSATTSGSTSTEVTE